MRVFVLAFACCACNQVYGIEDTHLQDGAPPDAPFSCPPLGTAPVFSRYLHQIPLRGCTDYTVSLTGRATAACRVDGASYVGEGPIDGELEPVLVGEMSYPLFNPRLSPDGERLYVQRYTPTALQFELYTRQGDTFALTTVAPFRNGYLSTIASGVGGGDLALLSNSVASGWDEMQEVGGKWTVVTTHTSAELGLGTRVMMFPNLSVDGLRLVFSAQREVGVYEYPTWYADRPQVGVPFGPAVLLEGVPYTGTIAVMNDTCARVYIEGLDRTFYVQQL